MAQSRKRLPQNRCIVVLFMLVASQWQESVSVTYSHKQSYSALACAGHICFRCGALLFSAIYTCLLHVSAGLTLLALTQSSTEP